MAARVFLAFLATAGLFYVNIMPAIVDGLKEGLNFTDRQAGFAASANVYGAAVGALLIVFIIRRLRWRPVAYGLLLALIAMDLLSMLVSLPDAMIAIRFAHGFIGGALVGTGFSVIARTENPDRTFGVLLFIQFGLGGVGNLFIPRLVPIFGTDVLFFSLIAFSLATLTMIPFLDQYPVDEKSKTPKNKAPSSLPGLPIALVLISIFLFQAANNGLFAFIIGLGKHSGLTLDFITVVLAASGWVGLLGAALVIVFHTRFGRFLPLAAGIVLTLGATWALLFSESKSIFFFANSVIGITWAFVMSYLLGLVSAFDRTGQMAALGGFASKMGLATGPLVGGFLLGDNNYTLLIYLAVVGLAISAAASLIPARIKDTPETITPRAPSASPANLD
ncbi:major facilitator family transporter, putative [Luminiphilus syltensis NOR5-1B]|uniref:Major facilitator family transporter, putative n=2 Tax=Luminiphilus TaxID=1341118 RepID=B8KTF7_9GAMM|nr:major facilitator family transporter, putative [Luminiphilus syltensis NOR5-1B]